MEIFLLLMLVALLGAVLSGFKLPANPTLNTKRLVRSRSDRQNRTARFGEYLAASGVEKLPSIQLLSGINVASVPAALVALSDPSAGPKPKVVVPSELASELTNAQTKTAQPFVPPNTVTSSNESGPGSIEAVIAEQAVNNDPWIHFAPNVKTVNLDHPLVDNNGVSCTWFGGGVTFHGNGNPISLNAAAITLDGLHFDNAPLDLTGNNGEFDLANCTFNNVQAGSGVTGAVTFTATAMPADFLATNDSWSHNAVPSLVFNSADQTDMFVQMFGCTISNNQSAAIDINGFGYIRFDGLTLENNTSQTDLVNINSPGPANEIIPAQVSFTALVAVNNKAPSIINTTLTTAITDGISPVVPLYYDSSLSIFNSLIADNQISDGQGAAVMLTSSPATPAQASTISASTIYGNTGGQGDLINNSTELSISSSVFKTFTTVIPVHYTDAHNFIETLEAGGKSKQSIGLASNDQVGGNADFGDLILNPKGVNAVAVLMPKPGSRLINHAGLQLIGSSDVAGVNRSNQDNNIGSSVGTFGTPYPTSPSSGSAGGGTAGGGTGGNQGGGNPRPGSGGSSNPSAGTFVINTAGGSIKQANATLTIAWNGGRSINKIPTVLIGRANNARNPRMHLGHNPGDGDPATTWTTKTAEAVLTPTGKFIAPAGAKLVLSHSGTPQTHAQPATFVINVGPAAIRHVNAWLSLAWRGGHLSTVMPALEVGYMRHMTGGADSRLQQSVWTTTTAEAVISPTAQYEVPAGSRLVIKHTASDSARVNQVLRSFRSMRRAA